MKAILVTLLLIMASSFTGEAQKVFKGKWADTDGNVVLHLDLYEKTVTIPDMDDEAPSHGYLSTVYPIGFRMDTDLIESSTIDGNKAIVVFRCGRTDATGKAELVYNPSNGSMKFSVLTAPQIDGWCDCLAPDITLKKAK